MTAAGSKPRIAVTMGDPSGIGAEVIVKALADDALRRTARFIIYGMHEIMSYAADQAEVAPYWFREPHEAVRSIESGVVVADYDEYALLSSIIKRPTAEGGHASMRFLEDALTAVSAGVCDALVTGPINKTSWSMAGYKHPGHTEKLAQTFHCKRVTMMFVGGRLRIALASVHEGIFELRNSFTIGKVFQPIELMAKALRDWFGISQPRIAVAALNPHAGEGGLFGDEEVRIIEPAIVMARETGIEVDGPFPADSLFHHALHSRRFDGIVAMYHDQGLIPMKMHAFNEAVNLTLGIPIIRTSPSHGTAFDIVGQNRAHPHSMRAAIHLAIQLAQHQPLAGATYRDPAAQEGDAARS